MPSFNPHKIQNKQKRQSQYRKLTKLKESAKRDERLRRRRSEDKNPALREERRARNVPATIDRKRVWDEVDGAGRDGLGAAVDVQRGVKRVDVGGRDDGGGGGGGGGAEAHAEGERKAGSDAAAASAQPAGHTDAGGGASDADTDSMLGSSSSSDDEAPTTAPAPSTAPRQNPPSATTSPTPPAAVPTPSAVRFPTLFATPSPAPKILITTSQHSTLHAEATLLTHLFPSSLYIRRTPHISAPRYSIRDIATFASRRHFTTLLVLSSQAKTPSGLAIVHLPHGPTLHFSLSHWTPGAALPGHGTATAHTPELMLNNFRTPLGELTARVFASLFPPQPELAGRQVVTLHNQRDYIFVRRHRYVFRDKRATEKGVQGADGRALAGGVEGIRAGLQELGPRFTLKLRRVDTGVGRGAGLEWEWKAGSEKVRTRFQL